MPLAYAVSHRGVRQGHVVLAGQVQQVLLRELALVEQQKAVIGVVLDDVHVGGDGFENSIRLGFLPQVPQGHVEPVRRGDEGVGILRYQQALAVGLRGLFEASGEIVREAGVIPDVEVQGARGDVADVGEAVRLDLVRRAPNQGRRMLQVRNCQIEEAYADVAVPPVAV